MQNRKPFKYVITKCQHLDEWKWPTDSWQGRQVAAKRKLERLEMMLEMKRLKEL